MENQNTIIGKISLAHELFTAKRRTLLRDARIRVLLDEYKRSIDNTWELMTRVSIPDHCSRCAGETSGGCCFEGIEAGYDPVLLLINLLMDCELPSHREVDGSCFFVGGNGCKLMARYYFCVHYLCPGIKDGLEESQVKRLLFTVGEELFSGWKLEQSLRHCLKLSNLPSAE